MYKMILMYLICNSIFAYNLGEEAKFLHAKINESNKKEFEIITFSIEEYDQVLQAYKLKQTIKSTKQFSLPKVSYMWAPEIKLNLNNWVSTENCIKARSVKSSFLTNKNNEYLKIDDHACLFDLTEVKNFGLFNPFQNGSSLKKIYFHNEHQENFLNIMRVDGDLDTFIFLKSNN